MIYEIIAYCLVVLVVGFLIGLIWPPLMIVTIFVGVVIGIFKIFTPKALFQIMIIFAVLVVIYWIIRTIIDAKKGRIINGVSFKVIFQEFLKIAIKTAIYITGWICMSGLDESIIESNWFIAIFDKIGLIEGGLVIVAISILTGVIAMIVRSVIISLVQK